MPRKKVQHPPVEPVFCQYRRTQIAELADWTHGMDMDGVSISEADREDGSPKQGDKIARNSVNHADRWLVAADYFAANFEPLDAPLETPSAERQVDFVWVGCGTCFQPQDPTRPVRAYQEWLTDAHRHRAFFCRTCATNSGRHVEVFPTLWAMSVSDWWPFREGGEAPEGLEVQRFNG